MNHQHSHNPKSHKKLWLIFGLSFSYMVAEWVAGVMSSSLALLADAGHMAIDSAGVGLGLFASWIAQKPRTETKTFGYYRAEILAAFVNGMVLIALSGGIILEALHRFQEPREVSGPLLFWVALGGLFVNIFGLKMLHGHSHTNLNIKAVSLHLLSDALGSAAAIMAGIGVWKFGWNWIDPLCSIMISVLILIGSLRLVLESVHILLEGVPKKINTQKIKESFQKIQGVVEVFDLHVWMVSSGLISLSCHVTTRSEGASTEILRKLESILKTDFDIHHSTIQLEPEGFHQKEHSESHCTH